MFVTRFSRAAMSNSIGHSPPRSQANGSPMQSTIPTVPIYGGNPTAHYLCVQRKNLGSASATDENAGTAVRRPTDRSTALCYDNDEGPVASVHRQEVTFPRSITCVGNEHSKAIDQRWNPFSTMDRATIRSLCSTDIPPYDGWANTAADALGSGVDIVVRDQSER